MRKVVSDRAAKSFFQRMSQTLRQMLGRGCQDELSIFLVLPTHYSSHRIVFSRPAGFVAQEPLDLAAMRNEKVASYGDKAAASAALLLLARGTQDHASRTPGSIRARDLLAARPRPTALEVNSVTSRAHGWFARGPFRAMPAGFVIDPLRKRRVGVTFVAAQCDLPTNKKARPKLVGTCLEKSIAALCRILLSG